MNTLSKIKWTGWIAICFVQFAYLAVTPGQQPTESTRAPVSNDASKSVQRSELESLIELENRVKQVLPKILPCVVSVEGGTGVIVSRDGDILTASHVTKQAGRSVKVQFSDGRVFTATTLGTNHNSDTAALRLDSPGPWPFVNMSDSTLVREGDWCLSLGYPLSFPRGKPAIARIGRVQEISESRLVTDCPIMGGDSGGPVVNLNGNLIGINSRVHNQITQNIHVPIQAFQDDWKQLAASIDIKKKSSPTGQRAYLGILGETDLDRVRVRSVHKGSPAESAGLLAEDVILKLDGEPIGTFDDVLQILDSRQPGEQVVATLNRFGQLVTVEIKLGQKY